MNRIGVWLLCCVLLAAPGSVLAQPNGVRVENAWSRAAQQGRVGVVYLTVIGEGAADRLIGIASPVAEKAELHESFTEQGVAKMREVAALPVEPGKPVVLAPGGYHIMLVGLKQQLSQGDVFSVFLTFEKAGRVAAVVTVQRSGGTPGGHGRASGMHMEGLPSHDPGAAGKTR